MPRAVNGTISRNRKKKFLKMAKGFRGSPGKLYRKAREAVEHSLSYAYRDRRVKKRDFRRLWIARVNAAVREAGMTYSQFMHGLRLAKIEINRKMLSELAIHDACAFKGLMDTARSKLVAS